jgi:hypothetical protein
MQMLTAEQKWITPETTAEAMLDLLTKEEYTGGTILEVSGSGLRVVKELGVRLVFISTFRSYSTTYGTERKS